MYLSDTEKNNWEAAVIIHNHQWKQYAERRSLLIFAGITAAYVLVSVAAFSGFLIYNPPYVPGVVGACAAGFLLMLPVGIYVYKKLRPSTLTIQQSKKWFLEIETVRVDSEDRQKFLELIRAMKEGDREMIRTLVERDLQSSHLSQTSFLMTLQKRLM